MSEWLDLMLDEISRKQRESQQAEEELRRREKTPQKNADKKKQTTEKPHRPGSVSRNTS